MTLPVVIDANTRMSLVTYAKYQEDNARKRLSLQTMLYGYALEPGDLFRLVDIAGRASTTARSGRWSRQRHGANYINEISAEAILKCAFEFGRSVLRRMSSCCCTPTTARPPTITDDDSQ